MIVPIMGKDSRWLQVEVCREFQRGKCSRTEEECRFAHPPAHVVIHNGRVTACFDSLKVDIHQLSFLELLRGLSLRRRGIFGDFMELKLFQEDEV